MAKPTDQTITLNATVNVNLVGGGTQNIMPILQQILSQLGQIAQKETQMAATLDDVLAGVNQESTVDDSIITLLNNLAAQIAAGGLSPADQAKVQSIFDVATANAAKVSAAVTANTPAAP